MKIADLKQPYRRMAEYLGDENNTISHSLSNYFFRFYNKMHKGENPEITEEIKKHFPPDFDFSGEEIKTKPVMQMLDTKTQKYIYTQLAKEGKFDQLPDTCEFSEAVDLEVSDCNEVFKTLDVVGKFKGKFVEKENISCVGYTLWNFAKLPTKKIDFSEFKSGDVVELEYYGDEGDDNIVGYIYQVNDYSIRISSIMSYLNGYEIILKQNIKSITKIK